MVGIPLDVFWSKEQMTPEKAAEILTAGMPTSEAKVVQYLAAKTYLAFVKSGKPLPQWEAGTGQYTYKNTTVKEETSKTLIYHENFGGHAIQRHVGKSDAQLLSRFESEPKVLASSTFTDIKTADRAIGNGIRDNQDKLSAFMKGSDTRIVLTHEESTSVGRVIPKGQTKSHASNQIVIVIDKDPLMPNGYRIQTAYPK